MCPDIASAEWPPCDFFACCDRPLPSSVSLPQTHGKRQRLLTLAMCHSETREFVLRLTTAADAGVKPVGPPGNPIRQGVREASTSGAALSIRAGGRRRGRRSERGRLSKRAMPAHTASAPLPACRRHSAPGATSGVSLKPSTRRTLRRLRAPQGSASETAAVFPRVHFASPKASHIEADGLRFR